MSSHQNRVRVELYEFRNPFSEFDEVICSWAEIGPLGIIAKGSITPEWDFEGFTSITIPLLTVDGERTILSFAKDPILWAENLASELRSGQPFVRVFTV